MSIRVSSTSSSASRAIAATAVGTEGKMKLLSLPADCGVIEPDRRVCLFPKLGGLLEVLKPPGVAVAEPAAGHAAAVPAGVLGVV